MLAYLDCSSGISGDKFLAALLDTGRTDGRFTIEHLQEATRALGLVGVSIVSQQVTRAGMAGLHVLIHAEKTHAEKNDPCRHWADIRTMIERASLVPAVRERALRTFSTLATAEGKVHGVEPEYVHFHEIGSVDSIVDIVGVSLGLELLGIEQLVCSTVAVGAGTVSALRHGILPVPAPATLELLTNVPIEAGSATGELTTPTGAALIASNADRFGPLPAMIPSRIGYGAGTREIDGLANIARIVLGHPLMPADLEDPLVHSDTNAAPSQIAAGLDDNREPVVLLETTLDHLSPEHIAFAAEELRTDGALDVWQIPAAMKKGRLGIELRVLVRPDDADMFADRIHELTGSLGVRRVPMIRSVLAREVRMCEGPWGLFRAKVSGHGATVRIRPEHDEIARISRQTGESYMTVAKRLRDAAEAEFQSAGADCPAKDSNAPD